ncbi:hypothetical protein GWI33_018667 [Rhynchophorus ferrugineus]|uniref:Uncharacterized protein n=1 Tax=Rhynchophorus ferrugineus TaxID=354439 RepID=A0A834HWK1_RHYFE|nr:hypothetical protein GWI33_018667 [Rhynchophorus ferrugineus]
MEEGEDDLGETANQDIPSAIDGGETLMNATDAYSSSGGERPPANHARYLAGISKLYRKSWTRAGTALCLRIINLGPEKDPESGRREIKNPSSERHLVSRILSLFCLSLGLVPLFFFATSHVSSSAGTELKRVQKHHRIHVTLLILHP